MSETITLKEQIQKQLAEKGTLSGDDLAKMAMAHDTSKAQPETSAQSPQDSMGDTTVKVGPEFKDKAIAIADADFATELMMHNDMLENANNPSDPLGLVSGTMPEIDVDTVTITAEDKLKFQDCLLANTRFERAFTAVNGKITGKFRARKNLETRAMLLEVARQVGDQKLTVMEHAAKLRHALLHFQLAELNGVVRPEVTGQLRSVEKFDEKTGKVIVVPPPWLDHMDASFNDMSEGLMSVLYAELRIFEKVYWTMVNSAKDQNFWNPEDSIIS